MILPFEETPLMFAYECAFVVDEMKRNGRREVDMESYESLLECYMNTLSLFDELLNTYIDHVKKYNQVVDMFNALDSAFRNSFNNN